MDQWTGGGVIDSSLFDIYFFCAIGVGTVGEETVGSAEGEEEGSEGERAALPKAAPAQGQTGGRG